MLQPAYPSVWVASYTGIHSTMKDVHPYSNAAWSGVTLSQNDLKLHIVEFLTKNVQKAKNWWNHIILRSMCKPERI